MQTPTWGQRSTTLTVQSLTNDQLHRAAPSIFATTPWRAMSDTYKFVPTIEIVDVMRDRGFLPTKAIQSRSRLPGKAEFTKHMIRFRHADNLSPMVVGDEMPEIVLVNSHDGTAAYQSYSGLFRLVCSNGLMVHSATTDSLSVRHTGGNDWHQKVIDATFEIVHDMPAITEQVKTFKQIELSPTQQTIYAEAAREVRATTATTITPAQLLTPRRIEDRANDAGRRNLWTTLNTVQENMVKGGLQTQSETGRRTRTRPIKSVDGDVKTNRALWLLADRMAQLAN